MRTFSTVLQLLGLIGATVGFAVTGGAVGGIQGVVGGSLIGVSCALVFIGLAAEANS